MISEISIKNFKSIEDLTLPLGRITVLIGENGSGKSNILEAIAVYYAAMAQKLDDEFLFSRGVRTVDGDRIATSFRDSKSESIVLRGTFAGRNMEFELLAFSDIFSGRTEWGVAPVMPPEALEATRLKVAKSPGGKDFLEFMDAVSGIKGMAASKAFRKQMPDMGLRMAAFAVFANDPNFRKVFAAAAASAFVIYAPDYQALRTFDPNGQIRPVGFRGEGLFQLLQRMGRNRRSTQWKRLKETLEVLSWFENVKIPSNLGLEEARLELFDKYMGKSFPIDQRSTNEGFLFLLFYFVLFLSPQTPGFFAIDNIDTSLNPKLCAELMRRLVQLAKENEKQVILTTHNPGLLDGLDLTDPEQKLYAISRNATGRTVARAVPAPVPLRKGDLPLKLSHAFLQGLLGAVPKNF